MHAATVGDRTKPSACDDYVAHLGRLSEVILEREIPGGLDDAKALTVARYERRIDDVQNPPEVGPPIHGNRAFPLSTYGHRVAPVHPTICRSAAARKRRSQRVRGPLEVANGSTDVGLAGTKQTLPEGTRALEPHQRNTLGIEVRIRSFEVIPKELEQCCFA